MDAAVDRVVVKVVVVVHTVDALVALERTVVVIADVVGTAVVEMAGDEPSADGTVVVERMVEGQDVLMLL